MTHAEAKSWCGTSANSKCVAKYNSSAYYWWLVEAVNISRAWYVSSGGVIYTDYVTGSSGVRPAVDIPSTATMSGSGTKLDPYVIQ